jgi:hypothetical protein
MLYFTLQDNGNYIPTLSGLYGRADEVMNTIFLSYQILAFKKNIVQTRNTKSSPCDVSNSQNMTECIIKDLARRVGCLPESWSEHGVPICTTWEQQLNFGNWFAALASNHVPMTTLMNLTGCLRNCRYGTYEISREMEVKYDNSSLNNATTFYVYPKNANVNIEEEALLYTVDDLTANIGGYLGLLLGISSLSFYDKILHFLVSRCRKSKNFRWVVQIIFRKIVVVALLAAFLYQCAVAFDKWQSARIGTTTLPGGGESGPWPAITICHNASGPAGPANHSSFIAEANISSKNVKRQV